MAGDHKRDHDQSRNHERNRARDHGDRERSRSRDRDRNKFRSRRDEPRQRHNSRSPPRKRRASRSPGRRSGRDRERSTSPQSTRSRSPPRKSTGDRSRKDDRSHREHRNIEKVPPRPDTKMDVDAKPLNGASKKQSKKIDKMDIDESEDQDDATMARVMGFAKFRSTKQTKVPNNDWYGVSKEKKIEYRQYMNRKGGFNRPLSPSR